MGVRHSEVIVKELGLQCVETLSTPATDGHHESDALLDHEKRKAYHSRCARATCNAVRDQRMPKITVITNGAGLVYTKAKRPILGRLPEAGVQVQDHGQTTDDDRIQLYTLSEQCIRQQEHRLVYPHTWKPLHHELEQDAISHHAVVSRVWFASVAAHTTTISFQ